MNNSEVAEEVVEAVVAEAASEEDPTLKEVTEEVEDKKEKLMKKMMMIIIIANLFKSKNQKETKRKASLLPVKTILSSDDELNAMINLPINTYYLLNI